MSEVKGSDVKEQVDAEKAVDDNVDADAPESAETADQNEENSMPSPVEEEVAIRKKYGGLLPRKPPLISKDYERAFFDSADWALGKQQGHAEKPKGPLEALRPKLQPTPQQQVRSRRPSYASSDGEELGNAAIEEASMNQ